ncbi:TrkA C-terminal domain-containing protein [Natronococcus sp. A-GB1]|uniref:cation:proton antiporter regulatory subunit n=1 Tax=Natronococcus sp. A-GB1 TaxID=3037648 RepID=UPI00242011A9|nr:TrkA C-terminal domain-containing protein [Natronococcus sp. A-GB1]MDG5762123.1 TrkA C-terminal domain-containing protein [Natronococcus sp. A-GB1]
MISTKKSVWLLISRHNITSRSPFLEGDTNGKSSISYCGILKVWKTGDAESVLKQVDLRVQTGCTVIAIERDDELITDLTADFVIQEEDILIAGGSKKSIERFKEFVSQLSLETVLE